MSDDEQVRRLLADAQHTEPLPPDVAARLDGVLADLGADRPLRPTVTDLAAARRRRRVRTLLIAAAAVVVVGIGIGQLGGPGTSDDDAADSASSATSDDAGGSAASEREGQDSPGDGLVGGQAEAAPDPTNQTSARLSSANFGDQALRLREQRAVLDRDRGSGAFEYSAKARCVGRDAGAGAAVPVRYDGSPAVLVYRAPRGDTQVVDLYLCGHDEVVRSITLPAR